MSINHWLTMFMLAGRMTYVFTQAIKYRTLSLIRFDENGNGLFYIYYQNPRLTLYRCLSRVEFVIDLNCVNLVKTSDDFNIRISIYLLLNHVLVRQLIKQLKEWFDFQDYIERDFIAEYLCSKRDFLQKFGT